MIFPFKYTPQKKTTNRFVLQRSQEFFAFSHGRIAVGGHRRHVRLHRQVHVAASTSSIRIPGEQYWRSSVAKRRPYHFAQREHHRGLYSGKLLGRNSVTNGILIYSSLLFDTLNLNQGIDKWVHESDRRPVASAQRPTALVRKYQPIVKRRSRTHSFAPSTRPRWGFST